MTLKKSLKITSLIFLGALVLFFIYSLIPRVIHHKGPLGTALPSASLLSKKSQQELRSFIKDTASRMQIVMAVKDGKSIFEEGDTKKLINCHSARKSIMSLLYGIAQEKGLLRVDETLGEIGIDESKTPLTPLEKTATIRDLLMARSGVYLHSEAEVQYAKNHMPRRGQYKPGEFFFYNNFDFNVLGAILELKTGMPIGEFMQKNLAEPLGMEDFAATNVVYNSPWPVPNNTQSDYPVYWIFMSARDFAKIGVLVLQNGRWNNQQVVSEEWIKKSLTDRTEFSGEAARMHYPYEAFAYSWWIDEDSHTMWADGYGGQFLCIDRQNNLVVLQRNFTGNSLLSSGLFLMDKNRDNNPKSDLLHVHDKLLQYLAQDHG